MGWNVKEITGYEPKTTFWDDFTIAENFGREEIEDTASRAFEEWKDNYEFLTELIMVINHKSWEHSRDSLCNVYVDLFYEYDGRAINYLEETHNEEGLNYFFRTLD